MAMLGRVTTTLLTTGFLLTAMSDPAAGQQDPPASASGISIEALMRTVEAQQKLIDAQGQRLEELQREIAAVRALTANGATAAAPLTTAQAAGPAAAVQPATEQEPARIPELPPDVVSASEFPGSFKVPGTDAALKIGGMVRVNWVSTFDPLGVDDRFVTSAIPIAGSADAQQGGSVAVIATPSRFNFDLRTPTGVGYMRAFIEGDFAGSGNTLRLRHAYGQWRRLIFGQTWSTFADPEADPAGIDFEGLNAVVLFRQPQIRWSVPLGERVRLAVALEDPKPELTDADGVNQVPDFVARVRWEPRVGGHVQLSGLLRQLRGEPANQDNQIAAAGGYGVNLSGRLPSPYQKQRDHILFQQNAGRGIGRYITDLRTLGGQDGVFDEAANELRALDVFSGYVGYEHWWSAQFRSTITFGFVGVSNLDIQPDNALHRTRRSSLNFMWSPIPRLDLVSEFLWGRRINKNGQSGTASQLQIGSNFRF